MQYGELAVPRAAAVASSRVAQRAIGTCTTPRMARATTRSSRQGSRPSSPSTVASCAAPPSSARTAELRKRRPRDRPQARPTNEGERGRQAVHNREHDDRSEPRNSLEAMLNDNRLDV